VGRYFNQVRFPSASQALTTTFALVNQSTVAFHSSGGVHLVIYAGRINHNGAAGADIVQIRLMLDGVVQTVTPAHDFIAQGEDITLIDALLIDVPRGDHTFTLEANRGAGISSGNFITLTGKILVIELPMWEASDRITSEV